MLKEFARSARDPTIVPPPAANDGGRNYDVRRLTGRDVLRAYPLARLAAGHLTLAAWLRFAAALGAKPPGAKAPRKAAAAPAERGLLGVEDQRGYLHALCSFAVEPDLRTGRRLTIDNLVALDLIDGNIPAQALVGALDKLARELDCPGYVVHLPEAASRGGRFRSGMTSGGGREHICIHRTLTTVGSEPGAGTA
ncbi:MAG: hypothetical protein C6Y20_19060 [Tagaea sp. CACIAM 22H2]|jgi:hypothetical protein|nr:hypothetical protein [Tagaea sp. CACIAM 22H2]